MRSRVETDPAVQEFVFLAEQFFWLNPRQRIHYITSNLAMMIINNNRGTSITVHQLGDKNYTIIKIRASSYYKNKVRRFVPKSWEIKNDAAFMKLIFDRVATTTSNLYPDPETV